MKKAIGIFAAVLLLVAFAGAANNTMNVIEFPGTTVGFKTTAAQAACASNYPCILIFDAKLATWQLGALPPKCGNCTWIDWSGIVDPVPIASPQLLSVRAMANPPTVTVFPVAVWTKELDTLTLPTDAKFRLVGTSALTQVGVAYQDNQYWVARNLTCPTGANAANNAFAVEFNASSAFFDIYAKDNQTSFRVWVNGEYVSRYFSTLGNTGDQKRVRVDFGSAQTRRVRVEVIGYFGGIITPSLTDVAAPDAGWTASKKVAFISDSYGEGTGATGHVAVTRLAADLLGWQYQSSACGGTGFLNPGTSPRNKVSARLAADVIAEAPDYVVWALGINDSTYTEAQVRAAALADFEAVAAGLPTATQLVFGPWEPATPVAAGISTVRDALALAVKDALAANINIVWVADPVAETWITGIRTDCTTGNACLYISGDNTHPTQAGHDYLGFTMASKIARLHPELLSTTTAATLPWMATTGDGTTIQTWKQPQQLNGTISTTATSAAVVGVGTAFTTQLRVGDVFAAFGGGDEVRTVATITDDTHLTVTVIYNSTRADAAYILTTMPTRATLTAAGAFSIKSATLSNVTAGHVLCAKADKSIGSCGNDPSGGGTCTCN